jgi:hypothetical protein
MRSSLRGGKCNRTFCKRTEAVELDDLCDAFID